MTLAMNTILNQSLMSPTVSYFCLGWLDSTYILLKWFLTEQPPGFASSAQLLWQLMSDIMSIAAHCPDVSPLELLCGETALLQRYIQHFTARLNGHSSTSSRMRCPVSNDQCKDMLRLLVEAEISMCRLADKLNFKHGNMQLLHSFALADAALACVAGACTYLHGQYQAKQAEAACEAGCCNQKQCSSGNSSRRSSGTSSSSTPSSSSSSHTVASTASSSRCSSDTPSSSTPSSSSSSHTVASTASSSGSSSSSTAMTTASSSSSVGSNSSRWWGTSEGFPELLPPPDHDQVVVVGGKQAVAAHAKKTQRSQQAGSAGAVNHLCSSLDCLWDFYRYRAVSNAAAPSATVGNGAEGSSASAAAAGATGSTTAAEREGQGADCTAVTAVSSKGSASTGSCSGTKLHSVAAMQLVLEAVVLASFAGRGCIPLSVFISQVECISMEQRRVFIKARGHLVLELAKFLVMGWAEGRWQYPAWLRMLQVLTTQEESGEKVALSLCKWLE